VYNTAIIAFIYVMTTPQLSTPILIHPADLKADTKLTAQIINLINAAFSRSKQSSSEKWNHTRPRFPSYESYYEMLVEDAVVALIFDHAAKPEDINDSLLGEEVHTREEDKTSNKVVACAAAVPWTGGWAKEGAGKEAGWEIKAVAVDGEDRYLHKGLAVQVMTSLETYLVRKEEMLLQESAPMDSMSLDEGRQRGCVSLWILAAECINGAYWRRRGFQEVRRRTEGEGTWGCRTSFDLVVFRRDVDFDVPI
jgi:hypothetical protein